jgi:hypothetical protein
MATSLIKIAVLTMLAGNCQISYADALPDPTRPAIDPAGGGVSPDAKPVVSSEGLRTIIIALDRRSAIINGQQIPLGGKFGEERLMAVCEDSVVLQGVDGKREVSLYPDVVIEGRRNTHCITPASKKSIEAAPAPKKKLKKIGHAPSAGAAKKKEKSCK